MLELKNSIFEINSVDEFNDKKEMTEKRVNEP